MNEFLDKLSIFQYDFVWYAVIVGVLIALCSALIGVTIVLKRLSFIGDGLSRVAFCASSVAAIVNVITNDIVITLPATILCAVLLLNAGEKAKIKGDASVAMISVGALAIGYLLMNLFPPSNNLAADVCTTLFGSTQILMLTQSQVIWCAVLSVIVIALFVIFYNKIFAVTFDENFSRATGTRTSLYNLIIAVIIAVIIVVAMNLVGSLLISALLIFPALSAMRIFKNFKSVTICAAAFGVVCALIGLLASILFDTPVGSTIVVVDIFGFILFSILGRLVCARR